MPLEIVIVCLWQSVHMQTSFRHPWELVTLVRSLKNIQIQHIFGSHNILFIDLVYTTNALLTVDLEISLKPI